MSQESTNNSPQDTNSVEDATFLYALDVNDQFDIVEVKCTECDKVTSHEWTKIIPQPLNIEQQTDPLATMNKIRRIIMCTNCGNLSLKK